MDMVIKKGIKKTTHKIVIYGPAGIGKSTFASKFPKPVFIDTEDSTSQMNVSRFDKPTSWQMLLQQVKYVYEHPECCKTLVIDTADWAEQLEIQDLCSKKGITGLEDLGYGKGYQYSAEEFGRFLNKLSEIVSKGINVVIVAHAQLRKVELPDEMGAYDHWEMKTSRKVAPLIKEWCDALLFCNYKTHVIKTETGKHKAGGGRRVMYTSHHPCWDAKNRYGLPDECEFSYETIRHIIEDVPLTNLQPTEPIIEESTSITTPKQEEEQQQQSAMLEDDMDKLPKPLSDLMKQDKVSVFDLQQAIAKKGFFPAGTPIENIPLEFWKMTVSNWEKFRDFITEMNMQF